MNIEAIDFLNRLNESGSIAYADYSHLHDLLTSEEPQGEPSDASICEHCGGTNWHHTVECFSDAPSAAPGGESEYTPTTEEIIKAWRFFRTENRAYDGDAEAEVRSWLAAHDAEVRAGVVAEEPEWEYGVIAPTGRMVNNGDYTIQQTHRRRKAGPWVPVES